MTASAIVPDGQPRRLGLPPRSRALAEADLDLDAGVAKVERMGVTLAPVADDRNLAVEQAEIAVAENRRHPVRPFVVVIAW